MILRLTFFERLLHRLHMLPTPIMDGFGGVIFGRVLTIAVRRGVFESVGSSAKSAEEIADETRLNVRGVELIAESCVVGGYLERSGHKYLITGEGKKWLLRSSPQYLGNLIRYFETRYTRWADFEYSLEHGRPRRSYFDEFSASDWEIYVYGMRDLAKLLLRDVSPKLILPEHSTSLLDIGGSHGLWAMECCRRYPQLHATVMDFEPACAHTRSLAQQEGLSDRINTLDGDFTKIELPSQQNCILMFNVIHGLSDEENRALIARCHSALNQEGKLFILDQMQGKKSGSQLSQFMPLMVGLNLLNEIGGNSYSEEQVSRWCNQFSSRRVHKPQLPSITLIEATK